MVAYINNGLVQNFWFFLKKNIFKIPYFQKSPQVYGSLEWTGVLSELESCILSCQIFFNSVFSNHVPETKLVFLSVRNWFLILLYFLQFCISMSKCVVLCLVNNNFHNCLFSWSAVIHQAHVNTHVPSYAAGSVRQCQLASLLARSR